VHTDIDIDAEEDIEKFVKTSRKKINKMHLVIIIIRILLDKRFCTHVIIFSILWTVSFSSLKQIKIW